MYKTTVIAQDQESIQLPDITDILYVESRILLMKLNRK